MIATGNDPHADAEVRSHLPGLPDQENIQPLFDNETFEALQELVQGSAEMTELLLLITEYELEGPIQVRRLAIDDVILALIRTLRLLQVIGIACTTHLRTSHSTSQMLTLGLRSCLAPGCLLSTSETRFGERPPAHQ